MKVWRSVLAVGVVAAACFPLALGFFVASRAVAAPAARKRNVRLYGTTRRQGTPGLMLERSKRTSSPGTFSIWFEGGHAQLGRILFQDHATVMREIIRIDGNGLSEARAGSWSGYAHISAATLGLNSRDVDIRTHCGSTPAWRIEPHSVQDSWSWAIHIHGLGSTRAGMLRGVKVAAEAGMTSLVVSYRNDGEGPVTGTRKSTLGMDESGDVANAIDYAVAQGARRIVLFGWSMGANIALKLMVDSTRQELIAGVVAISPVLDWTQTLRSNCRRVGIPAFIGSIASVILDSSVGARILRIPHRIRLSELNWLDRAGELHRPILLIHGLHDSSVPIELSRQLALTRDQLVTLLEFDSDHTLEWNTDAARWEESVLSWITQLH